MSKVVLGGGLSGLSAAYYLSRGCSRHITLLEASDRLGGWIKSDKQENGVIFEQGPRTIRPRGHLGINTLNLIEELNLQSEILPITNIHPAAKNRMIYVNGELHKLPNSLSTLLTTQKPFTKSIFSQLLNDLKVSPKIVNDESIYHFTQRRFGSEIADYLMGSMIRGICAGDAKKISVNFLLKKAFQYEQEYGNVTKGILKNLFSRKENVIKIKRGKLATRSVEESWNVYTFKNGIEILPKALELGISKNVDIKKQCDISKIEFNSDGVMVDSSKGILQYQHLISGVGACALANLVENQHPKLASLLNTIKGVSVGVVNLEFPGDVLKIPGFGFLVPPSENLPILGVIYDSCVHIYDTTVLTVMLGGYWFKDLFGDNPSTELLLNTALDSVKKALKITDDPINAKVNVLKECIPQYVVGHEENINKIECYIKDNQLPLSLCGSSYYGVGINDVIMSAKTAVDNILRS